MFVPSNNCTPAVKLPASPNVTALSKSLPEPNSISLKLKSSWPAKVCESANSIPGAKLASAPNVWVVLNTCSFANDVPVAKTVPAPNVWTGSWVNDIVAPLATSTSAPAGKSASSQAPSLTQSMIPLLLLSVNVTALIWEPVSTEPKLA